MPRHILKIFGFALFVAMLAGCTGGGGVRARSYVMEKPRVDQEMAGGNYGYFHGTPTPEDRTKYKDTRSIYVLEFTKETGDPNEIDELLELPPRKKVDPRITVKKPKRKRNPGWTRPIDLPDVSDDFQEEDYSGDVSYVEYTVQKNDTLQKISKKFYDGYSKWPRIYEANKDLIKDPNRIKPGLTIRVPTD